MAYTRPTPTAADATWQGSTAYSRPTPTAAGATFATGSGIDCVIAASVPITATMSLEHDVLPIDTSIAAVIPITAALTAAHGVSIGIAAVVPITAVASLTVERYELKGEVRLGGMLVDRRVRAYLRSSGALVAEADTSVGKFRVPVGFTQQEFYITPIDLGVDATDWIPPTANRVLSALASDT